MMYHNIIRRVPRPRGLGGVAHAASGMGAWVVDRPWGLSPAIIPGQPQPYQGMVRTQLPRSQHPRLLNVDYRVVAGGSWPRLLPANSPVFRTPVMAPGAQAVNETLPGDPVPSGTAGYGWVPLGVAHPPYFLAERHGMSGYGQATAEPIKLPDGTMVSGEDAAWLHANPRAVKQAITDSAVIYAALRAKRDMYIALTDVFATELSWTGAREGNRFGTSSHEAAARAAQIVFGGDTPGEAMARKDAVAQRLKKIAAQSATIDLIAKEAGVSSGPISVLSTTGKFSTDDLLKSSNPPTFRGFGIAPAVWVGIAVVAALATGVAGYSLRANFDQAHTEALKLKREHLQVIQPSLKAATESLNRLQAALEKETDPTRRAQIRNDMNEARKTLSLATQEVNGTWGAATETDWSTWALIGGAALGVWFLLGRPFWKGARTRAGEFIERRRAPRDWLGAGG